MSDFSYVKSVGLVPARKYAERQKTDLIIEHHSSTPKIPMTDEEAIEIIKSFHQTHINKGNRGIDYNFLVAGNGSVFDGRGLKYEGGHVLNGGRSAGMNARSVGICAIGDFEHNQMPEAMEEGLKRITRDVAQHYGITQIIRHKDVKDTDCPGQYFPFDEIKAYALGQDVPQPSTPAPAPSEPATSDWEAGRNMYRGCHVELQNYMNFRTGPGENHSVIRKLYNGTKLVLLDNCGNGWLNVYNLETGEQGYVSDQWIVFDEMMSGEDVRGLQKAINKYTGLGIS